MPPQSKNKALITAILASLACLIVIVLMVAYPNESLSSALRGVSIWWDVLFPALLPFFVLSEIMLGFGLVHFFGMLLDPIMRPVFRIPGIGGFVMALGFASGYPVAAKLTSKLWEQRLINREEGERLISFTTTSDPIFLIGAVSVGFFHDVSLAIILAAAHYGSAILIGLGLRYHGRHAPPSPQLRRIDEGRSIWYRSLQAMHRARLEDGRDIGTLLQDAIRSSLSLIFIIGALVVFFSVVLEALTNGQIMAAFYWLIDSILGVAHIPSILSEAIVNGMFEVTLGAKAAGSAGAAIPLIHKTAIAAFVLSWGGLSVHMQILSLIHHTNMRYLPFLLSRLIHGVLASVAVYIIWTPMQPLRENLGAILPVFQASSPLQGMLPFALPLTGLVIVSSFVLLVVLFLIYIFLKHTMTFAHKIQR